MKESFRIEFDRPDRTYRFGEVVSGVVLIRTSRGDSCKEVRLRSCWETHGKGNVDKGGVRGTLLHSGPLEGDGPHVFEFRFPAPPGPFSYHGNYLNVDQFVEVQVDMPWGFDPKLKEEFILLPGKKIPPPGQLLEETENPAKNLLPGCAAFAGAFLWVFGLFMALAGNGIGVPLFVVGLVLFFPLFRKTTNKKLGEISAFMTSLVVSPGGEAQVEVRAKPGKALSLNKAFMELTAKEVCISGSGSSRRTHRNTVFSDRCNLSGAVSLEKGIQTLFNGSIRIPESAPLSFKAGRNRLTWEARIQLDIPGWPDWVKKRPVVIWPQVNLLGPGEADEPVGIGASEEVEWEEPELAEWDEPEGLEPTAPERPEGVERVDPVPDPHVLEAPPWLLQHEPAPLEFDAVEQDRAEEDAAEEDPADFPEEPEAYGAVPMGSDTATEDIQPISAEPDPGPEEVTHAPTGLIGRIEAIRGSDIFRRAKEPKSREIIGVTFEFTIEVGRVDRSFGAFADPEYKNGRTVTGIIKGSDLEVVVLFPGARNEEVQGWASGSEQHVIGEVTKWDRLRKRPELKSLA